MFNRANPVMIENTKPIINLPIFVKTKLIISNLLHKHTTIATQEYDNIWTLFTSDSLDFYLYIYSGLLDPPSLSNDSIYYNESHQILFWDAPFTLDITDLDPDITYCVWNVNSSTCLKNVTVTLFILPIMETPVEYSISACNPVGCSNSTTVVLSTVQRGMLLFCI